MKRTCISCPYSSPIITFRDVEDFSRFMAIIVCLMSKPISLKPSSGNLLHLVIETFRDPTRFLLFAFNLARMVRLVSLILSMLSLMCEYNLGGGEKIS